MRIPFTLGRAEGVVGVDDDRGLPAGGVEAHRPRLALEGEVDLLDIRRDGRREDELPHPVFVDDRVGVEARGGSRGDEGQGGLDAAIDGAANAGQAGDPAIFDPVVMQLVQMLADHASGSLGWRTSPTGVGRARTCVGIVPGLEGALELGVSVPGSRQSQAPRGHCDLTVRRRVGEAAYVSASPSPAVHGAASSTALLRLTTMSSAPSVVKNWIMSLSG